MLAPLEAITVLLVKVLLLEETKKMPLRLFNALLFVSVLLLEYLRKMPSRLFNALLFVSVILLEESK